MSKRTPSRVLTPRQGVSEAKFVTKLALLPARQYFDTNQYAPETLGNAEVTITSYAPSLVRGAPSMAGRKKKANLLRPRGAIGLLPLILIWLGALHLCFRGIDTRFPQKARKTHPWRATLRHDFLQRGNVPTRQDQRGQCEAPSVPAIERGGAQ